ncbi:hypothetical protein [Methylobacterium sp. CCH5-D2]|uniref:hypothetical protein n=1 Tax=Methylobacterium sp. CCH5-D2 TaxID=1768765 RepID=UPI0008347263|nr:hypothetical protein [Methylobacterium sp. CCH5-D2]
MAPPLKRRFDYVAELRAFADQVEALALASNTDPAEPVHAKLDLARAMRRRANEVARRDDPAERGTFRAQDVFANFGPKRAGHVAKAEVRAPHRRIAGTIGLASAA